MVKLTSMPLLMVQLSPVLFLLRLPQVQIQSSALHPQTLPFYSTMYTSVPVKATGIITVLYVVIFVLLNLMCG